MHGVLFLNNTTSGLAFLEINSDVLQIDALNEHLVFGSNDFENLALLVLVLTIKNHNLVMTNDVPFLQGLLLWDESETKGRLHLHHTRLSEHDVVE